MTAMREYLDLQAVSAGVIGDILNECAAFAWWNSAWNPQRPMDPSDEADIGTIAHALLLEGESGGVAVIDPELYPAKTTGSIPDGWTNNAIRAARDEARAQGKIPVLKTKMAEINAMVKVANDFLWELQETETAIYQMFQTSYGESEQTFTWTEGDTLCKMRPDRISADKRIIVNYKSTSTSVNPDAWGRGQYLEHYVGAAWYRRGIMTLFQVQCEYVYLVQSTKPPYLCSLVGVDPAAFAIGGDKCEYGLREWQKCAAANQWPAYPRRVVYPTLPPWELARFEEREIENYGEQR